MLIMESVLISLGSLMKGYNMLYISHASILYIIPFSEGCFASLKSYALQNLIIERIINWILSSYYKVKQVKLVKSLHLVVVRKCY